MEPFFRCMFRLAALFIALAAPAAFPAGKPYEKIDPSTLRGKFMCGYQGWFRTPGDGADMGWNHYSRLRNEVRPDSLVVDMWPDVSEFGEGDTEEVPSLKMPDGSPARAVSSHNPRVIDTHFRWMAEYGIDGVWLQHFLIGLKGGKDGAGYMSRRNNMEHVKNAAEKYGRVWAVSFDTVGVPPEKIAEQVIAEWKRIVDAGYTESPAYLREGGLPVVHVWGYYYLNEVNLMNPAAGRKIFDFFNSGGKYAASLVGGGSWDWASNPDSEWREMYSRFKFYTPWNVGNKRRCEDGTFGASMGFWKGDKAMAEKNGTFWIPVVYPGFTWDNLRRTAPGSSLIPRKGGDFFWEQFYEAAKLGVDTFYIAMFDEIDEGTAIFKIEPNPPVNAHFVGTDGMPSDWWLRLAGEARRIIKSGEPFPREIPIKP